VIYSLDDQIKWGGKAAMNTRKLSTGAAGALFLAGPVATSLVMGAGVVSDSHRRK